MANNEWNNALDKFFGLVIDWAEIQGVENNGSTDKGGTAEAS